MRPPRHFLFTRPFPGPLFDIFPTFPTLLPISIFPPLFHSLSVFIRPSMVINSFLLFSSSSPLAPSAFFLFIFAFVTMFWVLFVTAIAYALWLLFLLYVRGLAVCSNPIRYVKTASPRSNLIPSRSLRT
ncbi:hypothetical protein GYMLUDRAFT_861084 [Collybiopsis luxurians FD-317 M1]|nr:hypothetical protein GYMLUDRAFT_861084 [Collybiopsis luxurians FD-317 M1]